MFIDSLKANMPKIHENVVQSTGGLTAVEHQSLDIIYKSPRRRVTQPLHLVAGSGVDDSTSTAQSPPRIFFGHMHCVNMMNASQERKTIAKRKRVGISGGQQVAESYLFQFFHFIFQVKD